MNWEARWVARLDDLSCDLGTAVEIPLIGNESIVFVILLRKGAAAPHRRGAMEGRTHGLFESVLFLSGLG